MNLGFVSKKSLKRDLCSLLAPCQREHFLQIWPRACQWVHEVTQNSDFLKFNTLHSKSNFRNSSENRPLIGIHQKDPIALIAGWWASWQSDCDVLLANPYWTPAQGSTLALWPDFWWKDPEEPFSFSQNEAPWLSKAPAKSFSQNEENSLRDHQVQGQLSASYKNGP